MGSRERLRRWAGGPGSVACGDWDPERETAVTAAAVR
jgi:hypothetical protein